MPLQGMLPLEFLAVSERDIAWRKAPKHARQYFVKRDKKIPVFLAQNPPCAEQKATAAPGTKVRSVCVSIPEASTSSQQS